MGRVEGEILVNGSAIQPKLMQQISCYVMQNPVLLSSATVRGQAIMKTCSCNAAHKVTSCCHQVIDWDICMQVPVVCDSCVCLGCSDEITGLFWKQVRESLMTSALLRIPLAVSRMEKIKLVEHIIDELVSFLDKRHMCLNTQLEAYVMLNILTVGIPSS